MPRYKLSPLPDLEALKTSPMIFYGAVTCWWGDQVLYFLPGTDLPCDPRGGVLMQTDEAANWIAEAFKTPEHYGKHGVDAFRAAFHGIVQVWQEAKAKWMPTCFRKWDEYNEIIDKADPVTRECVIAPSA